MSSARSCGPYSSIDVGSPCVPKSDSASGVSSHASAIACSVAAARLAMRYFRQTGTGPNGVRRVRGATMVMVPPTSRASDAATSRVTRIAGSFWSPAAFRPVVPAPADAADDGVHIGHAEAFGVGDDRGGVFDRVAAGRLDENLRARCDEALFDLALQAGEQSNRNQQRGDAEGDAADGDGGEHRGVRLLARGPEIPRGDARLDGHWFRSIA